MNYLTVIAFCIAQSVSGGQEKPADDASPGLLLSFNYCAGLANNELYRRLTSDHENEAKVNLFQGDLTQLDGALFFQRMALGIGYLTWLNEAAIEAYDGQDIVRVSFKETVFLADLGMSLPESTSGDRQSVGIGVLSDKSDLRVSSDYLHDPELVSAGAGRTLPIVCLRRVKKVSENFVVSGYMFTNPLFHIGWVRDDYAGTHGYSDRWNDGKLFQPASGISASVAYRITPAINLGLSLLAADNWFMGFHLSAVN